MWNFIFNRTLIVVTTLSNPYCMRKQTTANLTGNDQFEGYGVDVIHELSYILGFNYTFQLVPDGQHGTINRKTKQWNGMIKELMENRADLAIADLTINFDRKQVVDFTVPFMNLGISLLYRKPTKQPPDMFSFVSPLSPPVWGAVAVMYVMVTCLLYVLAKYTPHSLMEPSHEPHTVLEKRASFINYLWFTMGPLTQQGGEHIPSALSTRMVASMWWFFALIIISSYTANLAAFLTVEKVDSPIKSVEDLAKQTKIKYGVYGGGSTASFFQEATSPTYRRMWSFMESARPSVLTKSNLEGVERVIREKGGYAFLMESVSIQYVTERNCELAMVGRRLDQKTYGIAVPKNSSYLSALNVGLLHLHEIGVLRVLKTRWWKQNRGGGLCTEDSSASSSATKLGLGNVGGIFLVLACGACASVVLFAAEFVHAARQRKILHAAAVAKLARRAARARRRVRTFPTDLVYID